MSEKLSWLIPNNWTIAKLEDLVIKIIGGGTPSKANPTYYQGNIPWMTVKDMTSRRPQTVTDYITIEAITESATNLIPPDTIIIATRMSLGKIVRLPFEVAINQDLKALILPQNIEKDFIEYWFISEASNIQSLGTGTTVKGIRLEVLHQLKVPLSPLNEQRRIVAKIEALKATSQRVKEELEDIPQLLDQFRQSVLAAAFRGDLTADWREQNSNVESAEVLLERIRAERRKQYEKECDIAKKEQKNKPRKPENLEPKVYSNNYIVDIPESWIWTSFADIAAITKYSMSSGPFGSALGLKDYIDDGIPVIRGQNIQKGKFVLKNFVYISEEKASQLIRSIAYPGDIVIVAVGSSGHAAIVPKELPYAVLSQNCNKFTLDTSWVVPDFVLMLLQNEIAKSQMQDKITDTVRQFLSLTNLKSMLLPIPPLEEQKEIVYRVNALFRIVDIVNFQYQQIKDNLDHFDQSILAKAFRGELVPQDPDDEPASVLLERIRAERAKLQTKTAKKSTLRLGSVTTTKTSARRTKKTQPQQEESVQLDLGLE